MARRAGGCPRPLAACLLLLACAYCLPGALSQQTATTFSALKEAVISSEQQFLAALRDSTVGAILVNCSQPLVLTQVRHRVASLSSSSGTADSPIMGIPIQTLVDQERIPRGYRTKLLSGAIWVRPLTAHTTSCHTPTPYTVRNTSPHTNASMQALTTDYLTYKLLSMCVAHL